MAGKRMKRIKGRDVLLGFLIIAALVVAGWLAYHFYGEFKTESMYKDMKDETQEELTKKYKNMIGWLTVENTDIDYPVVRAPENNKNFYLDHDINGDWSINGCLFIDPRTDMIESYHTIIFGHHMANGTMFGRLNYQYEDTAEAKKHKTAEFTKWFKDGTYDQGEYKVYAAYPCSIQDKWSYLDFVNITNESEFDEYVKVSKEKSIIKSDVKPKYGDEMITLSTCSYHLWRWGRVDPNGRFVVVYVKDNHTEAE